MDISRLREALRQGCVDPFYACSYWKDSPSPPAAPDYTSAARAGEVNQITPFGTGTWDYGTAATPATEGHWDSSGGLLQANGNPLGVWVPGTAAIAQTPDTWTSTLSPDLQTAFSGITGQLATNMSAAPDLSSVQDIADKAYGAFTSRLDPQWASAQESERQRLADQGVTYGGQAYTNAMRDFYSGKNDAYQQAQLGAIQTMPQTYQLAMDQYNQPLNQLNAIRTGAQIQGPQFTGAGDYMGAANAQGQYAQGIYNANVGSQNAMTSGLFGLAGAGLGGYFGPWGAALGARAGSSLGGSV